MGGSDWLPYASIDRLLALCEASLERGAPLSSSTADKKQEESRRADLEAALGLAENRLIKYFKVKYTPCAFFFLL